MIATDHLTTDEIDAGRVKVEPDALQRVPRALALRYDILALYADENELTIAMPDIRDRDAIERVRLATGMHVRALPGGREAIHARLLREYSDLNVRFAAGGDEAPAISTLEDLQTRAIAARASDIHFEPLAAGGRVRQRIDGVLRCVRMLSADLFTPIVSRIKLLAGMDIADRRQPQDGRYTIVTSAAQVEARVSSVPTIHGEKLVVRLLDPHARQPRVQELGMLDRHLHQARSLIHIPNGLVLICGPTGSGKTTTAYAAISERNAESQNICSVEDPVEIRLPGITQVQVNPRAGVTFSSALRAFLRQDPNVIMVGELRDAETACVAAAASLTGQLVLATVHARDSYAAIERLLELGVSANVLSEGLSGVIAQRLVRRLCPACRSHYELDQGAEREFGVRPGALAHRARGCEQCDQSGYSGRVGIFEILAVDDAVRRAISRAAHTPLRDTQPAGSVFEPMHMDGVKKVLLGETTFDELRRILRFPAVPV